MTTDHLAKHSCGFRVEDWDTPPDATLCDGCGCDAQPFGNLLEIGECSLTVGDPSPAGRCPDCEGLCYVIEPETPTADEFVALLRRFRFLFASPTADSFRPFCRDALADLDRLLGAAQ